ncbi:MAG: hypothetical protein ABTQ27_02480 [Amaricoccus sp.]|uniref:hypothetical protein n=1 Tax=Amaricoccus sp. TaxID=1872485 RepID=UPI0033161961
MSPADRPLLNRRLVQAATDAIDYVTHEPCHIPEPRRSLRKSRHAVGCDAIEPCELISPARRNRSRRPPAAHEPRRAE